jgi:hypothetical protein
MRFLESRTVPPRFEQESLGELVIVEAPRESA